MRNRLRSIAVAVALAVALTGCPGSTDDGATTPPQAEDGGLFAEPTATPEPGVTPPAAAPAPSVPVPFIPAGRVGNQQDYDNLIARLSAELPPELRRQAPWPDLRNPDPAVVQREIFAFWVWITEHAPDPVFADAIAHQDGPARSYPVAVFGELASDGLYQRRPGAGYAVVDQTMATFESTDLPLWLARDVPEPAVVIWYTDQSGPVETVDGSGAVVGESLGSPPRDWLAIMIQTDVGWLMWVDQLIDQNDTQLQRPDLPPPNPAERTPTSQDV